MKIYLGLDSNDEYIIVEWNNEFSFLLDKYPQLVFYSTFHSWRDVGWFIKYKEKNWKVNIIYIEYPKERFLINKVKRLGISFNKVA